MASWSWNTCLLSSLYFPRLPAWPLWLSNFVQKASQLLYEKSCVDTACGVTRSSLRGFREGSRSNSSMAPLLAFWAIRAGRGLELVQGNRVILHGRRGGRKLRSTAENPSSGVGPASRIPWDGVMVKLRIRELKGTGLVSPEDLPEG